MITVLELLYLLLYFTYLFYIYFDIYWFTLLRQVVVAGHRIFSGNLRTSSSLTRDGTQAPCIGSRVLATEPPGKPLELFKGVICVQWKAFISSLCLNRFQNIYATLANTITNKHINRTSHHHPRKVLSSPSSGSPCPSPNPGPKQPLIHFLFIRFVFSRVSC